MAFRPQDRDAKTNEDKSEKSPTSKKLLIESFPGAVKHIYLKNTNVEICHFLASSIRIPRKKLTFLLPLFTISKTFLIVTLMEEGNPIVIEKGEFEYRDFSKLTAFFAFLNHQDSDEKMLNLLLSSVPGVESNRLSP